MVRIKREEINKDPLGYKPEGVARLLFKIFDGMVPLKTRNEKIVQGGKCARRLESDMYFGSEQRANFKKSGTIVS